MKQKQFKSEFADTLKTSIRENISNYQSDAFAVPEKMVEDTTFEHPEGLLAAMMPYATNESKTEYYAAIALYKAFSDLTPLQASYKPFWLYLSHVDLFPYMQKRWPDIRRTDMDPEDYESYVIDHWFHPSPIRNQLEGLYWMVRQTVQKKDDGEFDFTFTEFLFSRRKLGNRGVAASYLFRNSKVVKGILKFYMDKEDTLLTPHFEEKTDYCIQLMNRKGAVSELSLWNEDDVYNFLDEHSDEISKIIDRKVQKRIDAENAAANTEPAEIIETED